MSHTFTLLFPSKANEILGNETPGYPGRDEAVDDGDEAVLLTKNLELLRGLAHVVDMPTRDDRDREVEPPAPSDDE